VEGQYSDTVVSSSRETELGGVRSLVRRYGYGTILISSMLVLWWGVVGPYPFDYVAIAVQIASIAVVLSLEFLIPFQQRWGTIRNATRADVIYFLLAAPIDQLQVFLLVVLLAGTAQYHQYIQVVDFWPKHWPVLVQLFMVTLIVDLFKYWYHRWTHEVPWLWRIHSIHHSLDRLEMLRASYFFPLDLFITVATGTLALLMVGVDYRIIAFHNVWAGITGLLNHSNADLKCGFFDHFLNSIGHHRAHHSVSLPGIQSNYGSFFNFADRMFGTRYLPDDQSDFGALGLHEEEYDMPTTFLKQLAVPFNWSRVEKSS
jgi:sterol desaturase/sphingolipid hydroxylase (fatty acid hydroxylase superfamily)